MTSEPDAPETRVTRRASLARFGGLLVAGLGAGAGLTESATAAGDGGPAAVSRGLVSCVLTPELTEGPYYIPGEKVRRNITEGKPGAPLELHLGVLDVSTCRALAGATVDIWHCDAGGIYSGFVSASTGGAPGGGGGPTDKRTFLRGIQPTNAQGIATFQTIYPGWYRGRAVHIHVKVHLGGNVVHTGQLFFSDALTDTVYKRSPYKTRPNRDTRNADDSIYKNGGSKSVLAVQKSGSGGAAAGYLGKLIMGVHRT
jgi:protocatechuate 3,4-dioxygenase beta subunit